MLNYNGVLISPEEWIFSPENRAFRYGDALFETVRVENDNVVFWEEHYFRFMASMRMLRMEIPMTFTLEFLEEEILKTVATQEKADCYRVNVYVYRKDGGFYTPKTNDIDFFIKASPYRYVTKEVYTVDIFKDFYQYSGLLSTIKTTNRMLNVLSSVYMKENNLDNCILINERKGVVEATNATIFMVQGSTLKTPALTEGCIRGIVRKKILDVFQKNAEFKVEETVISPFEMQKADELFLTNTMMGVQPITNYRKKVFRTEISKKVASYLKK